MTGQLVRTIVAGPTTDLSLIHIYTTSNVMQAIAGKMSGVQVVQNSGTPGGDVSIPVSYTHLILLIQMG